MHALVDAVTFTKLFAQAYVEEEGDEFFLFVKKAMPFSHHLENFLTLNKFFFTKLKKKENMFPNIPLIPLHYQVHPPNFRKI